MKLGDLKGFHEVMCTRRKVILLEEDRDKWHRRVDLAHAIAHIDLAHRDRLDRKAEQAAVRYAAKLCIDLEPLGSVLSEYQGMLCDSAAHDLGVDLETLRVRLSILHPAERGYLRRTLSHLVTDHVA